MNLQRITIAPNQFHPAEPQRLTLTSEQVRYLRQVLRLRTGDQFLALNPHGGLWRSVLEEDPTRATLLEPCPDFPELKLQATLLVALPKHGFDEVVRQAVELGVKAIVPVLSERTLLQPSEQKQKRWQRIAQEAAEQCERNEVPVIAPPLPFAPALSFISPSQQRYFCITRRVAPPFLAVLTVLAENRPGIPLPEDTLDIAIVTGPEGGWTEAEENQALSQGWQPVSLGPLILRAVTAPLAAMSVVMSINFKF
jgi:16S rRNA (uracil1498-N3)-methyltransferase